MVSVDFDLYEGGESRRENIELSKDELEKLISSLEAANKVCTRTFIMCTVTVVFWASAHGCLNITR